MGCYRKKPVTVEAVQWLPDRPEPAPTWYVDAINSGTIVVGRPQLRIRTLEGVMAADPGDWIICGIKGEIYPCKPDIFEQTYELVNE